MSFLPNFDALSQHDASRADRPQARFVAIAGTREAAVNEIDVRTDAQILEAGLEPAISSLGGRRLIH